MLAILHVETDIVLTYSLIIKLSPLKQIMFCISSFHVFNMYGMFPECFLLNRVFLRTQTMKSSCWNDTNPLDVIIDIIIII